MHLKVGNDCEISAFYRHEVFGKVQIFENYYFLKFMNFCKKSKEHAGSCSASPRVETRLTVYRSLPFGLQQVLRKKCGEAPAQATHEETWLTVCRLLSS